MSVINLLQCRLKELAVLNRGWGWPACEAGQLGLDRSRHMLPSCWRLSPGHSAMFEQWSEHTSCSRCAGGAGGGGGGGGIPTRALVQTLHTALSWCSPCVPVKQGFMYSFTFYSGEYLPPPTPSVHANCTSINHSKINLLP